MSDLPTSQLPTRGRTARSFETTFLSHSKQQDAFATIERLRKRSRRDPVEGGDDPQAVLRSRMLLISGESGAGKTMLLENYLAYATSVPGAFRSTLDGDIRPVVYVPNAASGMREFVVAILKAFGYPAPPRDWTATDVSAHIANLCREMQVEVILVDEAQLLVQGKGSDGIQTVREFIKRLLNACPAQLVLAGVPEILRFLEPDGPNARDFKQIFRRRVPVLELTPYDWSVPKEQARFRKLLMAMQKETGLDFSQPLADDYLARRMYLASEGQIGIISKYLSALIEHSAESTNGKVGPEELGSVWWAFHKPVGRTSRPLSFVEVRQGDVLERRIGNPFLSNDEQLMQLWRRWALDGRPDETENDVGDPSAIVTGEEGRLSRRNSGRSVVSRSGKPAKGNSSMKTKLGSKVGAFGRKALLD